MELSLSNIKFTKRYLESSDLPLIEKLRSRWKLPSNASSSFYKSEVSEVTPKIQPIFNRIAKSWKGTPNLPPELMLFMNGTFIGHVNLRYYMRDAPPLEDLLYLLCIIRRNIMSVQFEVTVITNQEAALRTVQLKSKKSELAGLMLLDEEFKKWFIDITSPDTYGYVIRCYQSLFNKSYDSGKKKYSRSDFKRECKMFCVDPSKIKKFSKLSVYITLVVKGDEKPKTVDDFWKEAAYLEGVKDVDFKNFVKAHMYADDYDLWLSGALQIEESKRLYAQALEKQHANSYAESKKMKEEERLNRIVKINKLETDNSAF